MNILPENLVHIFNYLELEDVINCKNVCKNWRSTFENYSRIKQLVINDDYFLSKNKWSFTYQLIRHQNWINNFKSIKYTLDQQIFNNLKYLYIETDKSLSIINFSETLSKFNKLEHLEIVNCDLKNDDHLIELKNLIYLFIGTNKFNTIKFNTPKLVYLKNENIEKLDDLKIEFPLTIKHYETDFYHKIVKQFLNLEYFYCKNIKELDTELLIKLSKLKEIQFLSDNHDVYAKLKQIKPIDLKIYYFGILMECDVLELPDYELEFREGSMDELDGRPFSFIYKNRHQLANNLPFFTNFDNHRLDTRIINSFDFLSKFTNLNRISVSSELKNPKQFIRLLKNVKYLKNLVLWRSGFNQQFYEILPTLAPNLEVLNICDRIRNSKLNLENFLFKFKRLLKFTANQKIMDDNYFELASKIFKSTRLIEFEVFYNYTYSKIFKNSKGYSFETSYFYSTYEEHTYFDNLDDLFNYIKIDYDFDYDQYKQGKYPSQDSDDYAGESDDDDENSNSSTSESDLFFKFLMHLLQAEQDYTSDESELIDNDDDEDNDNNDDNENNDIYNLEEEKNN